VRAFGPHGAPAPDGKENFFIWGRFDEYNIANMLKNETAGAKRDRGIGTYPNTNYWLRIQRVGNIYNVSERASAGDAWNQVSSLTRTNFTEQVQVGIEHADYDGGRVLGASYRNFRLTVSNIGPFNTEPAPAKELNVDGVLASVQEISWAPGKGSDGSLVVFWEDDAALKAAPANGIDYKGDFNLPAAGYSIRYIGSGNRVTVTESANHVAVFSYTGSGKSITYSHTPARFDRGSEKAPTKTPSPN
jgi:hypothetical protein